MGKEVLYLSHQDVKELVTMKDAMQVVEETFDRQADPESVVWGDPITYKTEDRKTGFRWRLKTAILRDIEIAGVRVIGYEVDEDGVGHRGGPGVSTRYVILSDTETSSPLAFIDEHWSYSLRTSASVSVAAKYLANEDSKQIGIVGVGNVGKTFLLGVKDLFPIESVKVTSNHVETREEFAENMADEVDATIEPVDTAEEVCRGSDVICTATPVVEPFIKREWIDDGAYIAELGEELEPGVYEDADKILVDYERDRQAHPSEIQEMIEDGVITEESIYGELWEPATGAKPGRESPDETIIVKSVGITLQDIALGHWIYEKAKEEGVGIPLPFVGD